MRIKAGFTLILTLITCVSFAQVINGPVVNGRFEQVFLTENFDSISPAWPVVSTGENLLLIQEGELIIQRRAENTPFAVIASIENSLSDFRLVTSMKLNKAGTEGSIGLIFMAQTGGNGGFIFEMNNRQQYRLRQITGSVYRFMTGDARNNGWMKSSLVKEGNSANLVEVRAGNRKYDIYLNNRYLLSFTEMAYRSGNFGFLAGPASKGSVDFLYIFYNGASEINSNSSVASGDTAETDLIVLTESIIRLKTQVNKLNTENEELRQLLKAMKNERKDQESDQSMMEKTVKDLQLSNARTQQSYDSLLQVNAELMRYKTMVEGSGDGDVVISLSRSLKNEKLKNDNLLLENKKLRETIDKLKKSAAARTENP